MENIENLKKTNKALIVSNVVLGCLLILVMALFALVAIDTAPISASAAEEGYAKGELLYENTSLVPMQTNSTEATKTYTFNTDYIYYNHGKGLILTIDIDGENVEIPVRITRDYIGAHKASFNLNPSHDFVGYYNADDGKVTVIAGGENKTFTVKTIHRYEEWDADVDYELEKFAGKEYRVKQNLAKNIKLTKLTEENGFSIYESDTLIENIEGYDSLAYLPPLTKIELDNGYILLDRLSWEITVAEGTYWTNSALFYNFSVAGMEIYYTQGKFLAKVEGTTGPDTLEITSLDIITQKVENEFGAESIIGNISGAFTGFLTGSGEGIINFFETIITNGNGGLSVLAIVALSMMGLGIATGFIKYLLCRAS